MEPSTLTRNMQPLVAHGGLTLGSADDARSRTVAITEAGRLKRGKDARHAQLGKALTLALHQVMDECMIVLGDEEPDAQ